MQSQSTDSPEATRRVCLYFGSFNPIHTGHIALAQYALSALSMDEVRLVLSPLNPLKERGSQLPFEVRAELIRKAIAPYPAMSLSLIEQVLPEPHYTIRTLRAMAMLEEPSERYLLIGADNLLGLHRWHEWQRLVRTVHLIVYPRPGYAIEADDLPTEALSIHYCTNAPEMEISATELREALRSGKDLSHYLPNPEMWTSLGQYLSPTPEP